ncbi:hypothetical protein SCG7086_CT_00010 [Chlamydiales bacterium SCGC AG-110-P3]|nr:hypothetical protein SCG7086_CT_00010 [Chlamydiales bacterium SCGC AG-110-P3]
MTLKDLYKTHLDDGRVGGTFSEFVRSANYAQICS